MPRFFFLCGTLLASAWAVASAEAPTPQPAATGVRLPAHTRYFPDLVYATPRPGDRLHLDLAVPKVGPGPFPVVVLIHGGGWFSGTRKTYDYMLWKLTERGYAAVSVSYRFAPFPTQVEDVQEALRWLQANAKKYDLDVQHCGVWGWSSGGHQACLLGMAPVKDAPPPRCIVCYYGITDLRRLHGDCATGCLPGVQGKLVQLSLETLLGGSPQAVPQRYVDASPTRHIGVETPPIMLVHGTKDSVVPIDQSRHFYRCLKVWGVPARFLSVEGAPHNFIGETEVKANAVAIDFLDKHLKGKQ